MNSRVLMVVSAVVMGIAGIAAIFAPAELLTSLGLADVAPPLLVQLLGSLYFAFAIANWTAKDNPIGGIYSRPLSLGNFTHFFVGAVALMRPALRLPQWPLVTTTAIYVLFAIAFGALLFGQGPVGKPAN